MNIGIYMTISLGAIIGLIFCYFYSDKHANFRKAIFLYSMGSVFESIVFRLSVDPQLEFDFNAMVISEGAAFTANTILQAILIRLMVWDPVLSFGIANCTSCFLHVVAFKLLCKSQPHYSNSLALKLLSDGKNYLLPNTMKFSFSLAYNALVNDFFDQTYFVIFASAATYLGELHLIRGFGSLFIRFIYMPVNNVTYNLYSKLYSDASKMPAANARQNFVKMSTIVQMVVLIYSRLTYFMLAYGFHTSHVVLSLIFGSKWVDSVEKYN